MVHIIGRGRFARESYAIRQLPTVFDGLLNVRQFGATGNGVTDDTNAFVNAFAASDAQGLLYVPKGNYAIQAGVLTVAAGQGISVFGDFTGTTVQNSKIIATGGAGALLTAASGARFSAIGIEFDGGGVADDCINATSVNDLYLEHIWAHSGTNRGIAVRQCNDAIIQSCRASSNGSAGIEIGGSNGSVLTAIAANSNGGPGIDIFGQIFDPTVSAAAMVIANTRQLSLNGTAQIRCRGTAEVRMWGVYFLPANTADSLYLDNCSNTDVRAARVVPGGNPGVAYRIYGCRSTILDGCSSAFNGSGYGSIHWKGNIPDIVRCYQESNVTNQIPLPVVNDP